MKALLIIDLQKGSFPTGALTGENAALLQRINRLAARLRSNGDKIIIVQHDGTNDGDYLPGNPDWQLVDELNIDPSDLILSKKANDAFYNTGLRDLLIKDGITEVLVCGAATDFCIDATIKSGLYHDLQMVAVKDGHTLSDRGDITARQLIAHYNNVWTWLSPAKYRVKVIAENEIV